MKTRHRKNIAAWALVIGLSCPVGAARAQNPAPVQAPTAAKPAAAKKEDDPFADLFAEAKKQEDHAFVDFSLPSMRKQKPSTTPRLQKRRMTQKRTMRAVIIPSRKVSTAKL